MGIVEDLAMKFTDPVIDRSLDQEKLDLRRRVRTSLFPWRGQFSPELVELLLEDLPSNGVILDPFVGSGTTLFECARKGIDAIGAEINPAAICFATFSEVASQRMPARISAVEAVIQQLRHHSRWPIGSLFAEGSDCSQVDDTHMVKAMLAELGDSDAATIFRSALLLAMGNKPFVTISRVQAEIDRLRHILMALPERLGYCRVIAADARCLPLEDSVASGAITSPPYINVFNYHQQYRPAVELLGAVPLTVARAEIGANRKHRQNRFLTVVQYGLDMEAAIYELHRVLMENSTVKIIVGRESNVRGVPFRNGRLLASIAEGTGQFLIERWQERRFTTRFGASIYEDILTMRRVSRPRPRNGFTGREAAVWELHTAASRFLDPELRADLTLAIDSAETVQPSPLFDPGAVPWMRRGDSFHVASTRNNV
jgi:hypothetical protein